MNDLFKAECLRFRAWGIAAALLHLLMLGFMSTLVDMAQQPLRTYKAAAIIYACVGVLFGAWQMAYYRRANTWLNLLHRPISPRRIGLALSGAAGLWLLIAMALPILLVAAWQAGMTARVVDFRHLLLPLSAWLIAMSAYAFGAFCALGNRKYVAFGMAPPLLLLSSEAGGVAIIAVQIMILLVMLAMLDAVFKADLSAPPRGVVHNVIIALPVQMGIFAALSLFLSIAVQMAWIPLGASPLNGAKPPVGGVVEAQRADSKALLLAGLTHSESKQAALWREQIALSDSFEIGRRFDALPQRNSLSNVAPMAFNDEKRGIRWVFSHDRMRFEGHEIANRNHAVGELGLGTGNTAFTQPPLPIGPSPLLSAGNHLLLAQSVAYRYGHDDDTSWFKSWIALPHGEVFADVPTVIGQSLTILSDKALYFFDMAQVLDRGRDTMLSPRLRMPLPGKIGSLGSIDMIELLDGYLVSCTFTLNSAQARVVPRQYLLHVHDDGKVEQVAYRELKADYPQWFRYMDRWLSPALYSLRNTANRILAKPSPLTARSDVPVPRSVWWLAAIITLLSVLAAFWRLRRVELPVSARAAWLLACVVLGLPALLCLSLMYPVREALDVAAVPEGAVA